ncbi:MULTISPECIES: GntR family transcriptional regulator [unclassified Bradyrhizobium]|uniref:GntR family transcriptional regulator n=1 Tax=Bradyrhizobium sp. USDA 4541 TaxID=2817704 RepID=UPI0020A429F1|nr:GntR family transcriptional regulator [Bradyrhizobium sp. USDA 4541]MCP1848123.1 DNA-binding GntR family transcriptional regulator [Bradyrhizobium sp. USDA 4541]
MSHLKTLEHDNLSNTVYTTLCDALIKGQFQPGERLKIRDLAERLGTSVTPIRDAILRLAHDEAITFQSPRDIRIPRVTQERYLEIRSIRLRLEALAAETAAQVASSKDIETLEKILRENEKAIADGDRVQGTTLNQAFHFALPTIAKLPVLNGILSRIWLQMGPLIADSYQAGGRSMIDYHYPVVDALRRHDSQAAAAAIMNDITLGGRAIIEHFQTPSQTG